MSPFLNADHSHPDQQKWKHTQTGSCIPAPPYPVKDHQRLSLILRYLLPPIVRAGIRKEGRCGRRKEGHRSQNLGSYRWTDLGLFPRFLRDAKGHGPGGFFSACVTMILIPGIGHTVLVFVDKFVVQPTSTPPFAP